MSKRGSTTGTAAPTNGCVEVDPIMNNPNNHPPMAEATMISSYQQPDNVDLEASHPLAETEALLIDETTNSNNNNEKKADGSDPNTSPPYGYHVTEEGTKQYWGRFDDAQAAEATYTDEPAIATARPDDRQIRLKFIRKVYSILSIQLLTTFGICAFFAFHEPAKVFVTTHVGFYWFNVILCFGTLIPLHFYKRTHPTNMVLLSVFTVAMANMVGMVTTLYAEAGAGDLVLEAVAITASIFIVLTIYTMQSKWDFSFMGAGLGMCLWVMILWGFFALIFGWQTGMVYSLAGSILFSGFIIYDTYMIAERLDPEDYVLAAIELYLDLVNLFLYLLQFLAEAQRN